MRELNDIQTVISRAAEAIEEASAILITAGAGMGVDSGLPDFRGTEGFWGAYPALGRAGMHFGDIANPQAFVETMAACLAKEHMLRIRSGSFEWPEGC